MTEASAAIDDGARPRRSRWLIVRLAWCAAILAAVCGAYLYFHALPHSIHRTTLEAGWWSSGNWRNLSFDLSSAEIGEVKQCIAVAQEGAIGSDRNRAALEAILRQHPRYFYAEWLLGDWFAANNDATKAASFHQQAMHDAPVVLIQTYRTSDARPAAGISIQRYSIECNRVKNHSLDPSLVLPFGNLTTDAQGRIYLPVYNTVYRTDTMSFPDGWNCTYPTLGWFNAWTHLALLPDAIVTPKR